MLLELYLPDISIMTFKINLDKKSASLVDITDNKRLANAIIPED